MAPPKTDPVPRFLSKVSADGNGCWRWRAGIAKKTGYAVFWINGKQSLAHRYSYSQFVGPIPQGLTIDHLCRVRDCVNPAHLEAVTMRENTLRGLTITAANAQKTLCKRGHPFTRREKKSGARVCGTCKRAGQRARRSPMRGVPA